MRYGIELRLIVQVEAGDEDEAKRSAELAVQSAKRGLPDGVSVSAAMATVQGHFTGATPDQPPAFLTRGP